MITAAGGAGASGPARSRRRRLGQHLLRDGAPAIAAMVGAARLGAGDSVLEVGAGRGALTGPLCRAAGSVVSYEADESLLAEARARLRGEANLTLVGGDGFASDPLACGSSVFVSSLPYSQSRRAIEWLARSPVRRAVVMVQREFAGKISGRGPRRAVGVVARRAFDVREVARVGRGQFEPEPAVESAIVELRRRAVLRAPVIDAICALFSYRRKSLRNAVARAGGGALDLQGGAAGKEGARIDDLGDGEIVRIAERIAAARGGVGGGGGSVPAGPSPQPAVAVARASEYAPAEDTFLLDDHVRGRSGRMALDIGSGSGYITRSLEGSFETVVGTDISHAVLRGQTYAGPNRVCCDGADALSGQFDLVVCNLPYLATDRIDDVSTDGGPGGTPVPLRIVRSAAPRVAPGGSLLLVTSSLSEYGALIAEAERLGLSAGVLARKRLFFEELVVVEARRPGGLLPPEQGGGPLGHGRGHVARAGRAPDVVRDGPALVDDGLDGPEDGVPDVRLAQVLGHPRP